MSVVQNRGAADVQITAEHILKVANASGIQQTFKRTEHEITDPEELAMVKLGKRKEFENRVRSNRDSVAAWIKYANWEARMGEFARARSIFERALQITYTDRALWLKYAEMEMEAKFINRARNVWDRAVTILPRVEQFWYKYAFMEEIAGEIDACRNIFDRWMVWEPSQQGWMSYVKFEERQEEWTKARQVMERYCACHPYESSYLKYANWEQFTMKDYSAARSIFERCLKDEELPEARRTQKLFLRFAKFEEKSGELERARVIYKYALDKLPQDQRKALHEEFISFEKRHALAGREGIDLAVTEKRMVRYNNLVNRNPYDYDTWFDMARLMESRNEIEKCRTIYDRAVKNVPMIMEKRYWRRYVYLWIYYAIFEELIANNVVRTRAVYLEALNKIPHKKFTFAKLWIYYAKFEIRCKDIDTARKMMGVALGKCPKPKLFKAYIELELSLGEVDRTRKLYEKYLEYQPYDSDVWIAYADLEEDIEEYERTRGIYELALQQDQIDDKELIWKKYIEFEQKVIRNNNNNDDDDDDMSVSDPGTAPTNSTTTAATAPVFVDGNGTDDHTYDRDNVEILYERLLSQTVHVKVWLAYVNYLKENAFSRSDESREKLILKIRKVYKRSYKSLKEQLQQDSRALMLEEWKTFELNIPNNQAQIDKLDKKMPQRIKKRRIIDQVNDIWEEYYDFEFPEDIQQDESSNNAFANLKFLQMAQNWKKNKDKSIQGEDEQHDAD